MLKGKECPCTALPQVVGTLTTPDVSDILPVALLAKRQLQKMCSCMVRKTKLACLLQSRTYAWGQMCIKTGRVMIEKEEKEYHQEQEAHIMCILSVYGEIKDNK